MNTHWSVWVKVCCLRWDLWWEDWVMRAGERAVRANTQTRRQGWTQQVHRVGEGPRGVGTHNAFWTSKGYGSLMGLRWEALECFNQGRSRILCALWEDFFSCYLEDRLQGSREEGEKSVQMRKWVVRTGVLRAEMGRGGQSQDLLQRWRVLPTHHKQNSVVAENTRRAWIPALLLVGH